MTARPARLLRLLRPHTHAGCTLPAGAVHEFDATAAHWLLANGVAEPVAPPMRRRDPTPQPQQLKER